MENEIGKKHLNFLAGKQNGYIHSKVKLIKEQYELPSISEAIRFAIRKCPLPVENGKEGDMCE